MASASSECTCLQEPLEKRCKEAARRGHLHCLQTAQQAGGVFDEWTAAYAAASGSIPVLQWLLETGCFQDERICASAALCGHLHVLQWARTAGCPWVRAERLTCCRFVSGQLALW